MPMTFDFDKMIIDTVDTVTLFDKGDGGLLFIADQVTDGTMENGAEVVYGTGKSGVKLSALDRNKSSKFSFNNGYVLFNALAAQLGADVETASVTNKFSVPCMERIKVTDVTKIMLTFTPVGAVGNEIPFIYKSNSDQTQGERYSIAAAASEKSFALKIDTKEITLPTDIFAVGDIVIVPYRKEVTAGKKLSNNSDVGGKFAQTVFDVTCRNICNMSEVYHGVIEYGNSKIDGNFSLAFGNEPVKHPISIEAFLDICSTNKALFDYYIVE